MARPFEGVHIVDLTHVLAGPFCAYQLALLGADVIKIEPVECPDISRGRGPDDRQNAAGMGLTYQTQASNKRAIAVDIKTPGGQSILRRLIGNADVLIENYRTGALAALGFGYGDVQAIKNDIIYCSLTGFGQTGPRAKVNAYDNVIQATSGIMDRTGGVKTAASYVDYASGMNAAFAISAALYRRQREGVGTHIDCAMFDSALMLVGPEMSVEFAPEKVQSRPQEAGIDCYETADGRIMLGAFNFRQNARLWSVLDEPAFAGLKDWPSLWAAAAEMRKVLLKKMKTRSADEWVRLFHKAGLPAEKVRSLADATADPQLAARPLLHTVSSDTGGTATVPMASFGFTDDGPAITSPPPAFSEHTDAVLSELGFSTDEITAFRQSKIIA